MRDLEIVFFDAGGTLLRPEPGVGDVYAETGRRFGVEASPARCLVAFRKAFHARKREAIPQDREWWRDVVERTYAFLGEPTDPEGLFDALYEHFAHPRAWVLYPGARATIEAVAALGYRTGLLSNWDDRLPGLLEGRGIAHLLDPKVISCRVGAEKPDPRIYAAALEAAGVEASRALLVGDDREADVVGARAAGMRAVQLDRTGDTPANGPVIRRLRDLPEMLRRALRS